MIYENQLIVESLRDFGLFDLGDVRLDEQINKVRIHWRVWNSDSLYNKTSDVNLEAKFLYLEPEWELGTKEQQWVEIFSEGALLLTPSSGAAGTML
jgi:hypothetical protein